MIQYNKEKYSIQKRKDFQMLSYTKFTKLGKGQKGFLRQMNYSYLWHKQWLSNLNTVRETSKENKFLRLT